MRDRKEVEFNIMAAKYTIKKLLQNNNDYTPEEKKESLLKLINNLYKLEKELSDF